MHYSGAKKIVNWQIHQNIQRSMDRTSYKKDRICQISLTINISYELHRITDCFILNLLINCVE